MPITIERVRKFIQDNLENDLHCSSGKRLDNEVEVYEFQLLLNARTFIMVGRVNFLPGQGIFYVRPYIDTNFITISQSYADTLTRRLQKEISYPIGQIYLREIDISAK